MQIKKDVKIVMLSVNLFYTLGICPISFALYLLPKGCDINQLAIDKQSLLNDAANTSNKEAIAFLLANGIKREYLNSALCWAIIHNAVSSVRLLLDTRADLDEMCTSCKGIEKGLYHIAITRKGYDKMVRLLVERRINFKTVLKKAVVVGIDNKLSPFEYAKEKLQKWPTETYIHEYFLLFLCQ